MLTAIRVTRRVSVPILLLSLAVMTPAQIKGDLSPDQIYSRNKGSVVTILTFDTQNAPLSQGSGFVIAHNRIITNYHVVAGSSSATIIFDDGTKVSTDSLTAGSQPKDIVILEANTGNRTPLTLGNELEVKVGESVVAIGTPQGLSASLSSGLVSAFREDAGQFLIQITASISPGSSGGPLFDRKGHVVGMTTSKLTDGSFGFAVGSGDIQHILKVPLLTPAKLIELETKEAPTVDLSSVQSLYDQKKYAEASSSFAALPESLKTSYNGQLLLCKINGDLPSHDNEAACNAAMHLRPTEGAPYTWRAYALISSRNLEQAEENATRAVQISNDPDAMQMLGLIYYLQEKYSLVSKQIPEDTKDTFSLTLLEGAALRTGDTNSFHRLDEKIKSIKGANNGWQLYQDGASAVGELKWDVALDDFQKCDADSDFADSICAVSVINVELQKGSRAEAKRDADAAMKRYFDGPSVVTEAISVDLITGNKSEAKALHTKLETKATPTDAEDCYYYYAIDEPSVANSHCIANANANSKSNTAWSNAGYVALDLGQYSVALADFGKAEDIYEADKRQHTVTEEMDLYWGLLLAGYLTGNRKGAKDLYLAIEKSEPDFASIEGLKELPLVWSTTTLSSITKVIKDFK